MSLIFFSQTLLSVLVQDALKIAFFLAIFLLFKVNNSFIVYQLYPINNFLAFFF